MESPDDLIYMHRCLDLARCAVGCTSPNPMVGAVVVHKGKIIGEGYHMKAGTPHAEVHALNAVKNRDLLPEATMYVSLEPCSHYGRTPPCADMIIISGIRRVVVGTVDTSTKISGRGIARLREAGTEVITGVAEEECRAINKRFFTWHEKQRPYVILKWARSADGFLDLVRGPGDTAEPNWITGLTERILVHRWRAEEDAIMAGGGTVRADNPSLDVRLWSGKNPLRVIVSRWRNRPMVKSTGREG
jgi:diaminohydroxyphosphoribosylaminopyrimidine deaminase/5-amino-6-(5-phosphoribosylamino)uracil reductase